MKTVLVLSILLSAAFSAPAEVEVQPAETPVEVSNEQPAAAHEMEDKMMTGDVEKVSGPVLANARFNFCPEGWFSHSSRCYKFINSPKNWYSAKEYCNTIGSDLASVSSLREYRFLQQFTSAAGQTVAWLGGFNLQGRWMWSNREGFDFTNWYSQASISSYACVFLRTSNGWGNNPCTSAFRFICSKNPFNC